MSNIQALRDKYKLIDREEFDNDADTYFGLSYASWLVLPRIALQSMSPKWQNKFFGMIKEMEDILEFPHEWDEVSFSVTAKKGNKFVKHFFPHYRHNHLPKKNENTTSDS